MVEISLDKAQARLRDLVEAAIRGEKIWIVTEDHQGVLLVPTPRSSKRRQFGSAKGTVWMSEDFDAPLVDFQEYS